MDTRPANGGIQVNQSATDITSVLHEGATLVMSGYANIYEVGVTEPVGYKASVSFVYDGKSDLGEPLDHSCVLWVDSSWEYTAPFGTAHTLYLMEHGISHIVDESVCSLDTRKQHETLSHSDGVCSVHGSQVCGIDALSLTTVVWRDAPHTGGIKRGVSRGEVTAPI